MIFLRLVSLVLLGVSFTCCTHVAPSAADSSLRVLFVGNSLTAANELPQTVAEIAESRGDVLHVAMVVGPNYSLEDHWRDGRALERIRSGSWSVVVMQQGPSSLDESRAHLAEWAGRFAEEIRTTGARPVLMTVWPSRERAAAFPRVIDSYRLAAEACGCGLIPAGAAWHELMKHDSGEGLYGPDGFHPADRGTFLAALVAWSVLTGGDPATIIRDPSTPLPTPSAAEAGAWIAAIRAVVEQTSGVTR